MNLGLFRRREAWRLTLRGWGIVIGALALVVVLGVRSIHPFLAVHQPLDCRWLVVEGWVPDYAFEELRSEFRRGRYDLLVITGNPLIKGENLSEFKNFADLTRATLLRQGWDPEKIVAVPSEEAFRDRTFESAKALRAWAQKSGRPIECFNLLSRGAHARRSWLLYRMVFEDVCRVGIIAGTDLRYEGSVWWKSSEGVRDVLDETIAYLYAKFLFRKTN